MPSINEHNDRLAAEAKARRERIAEMLRAGVPQREVRRQLGISRQRMWTLVRQAEKEGLL